MSVVLCRMVNQYYIINIEPLGDAARSEGLVIRDPHVGPR